MNELVNTDLTKGSEKTFRAGRTELICALVTYAAAYLYSKTISDISCNWLWLVVAALLVLVTELLNRGRKAATETYVWLGCFVICVVAWSLKIGSVWYRDQLFLFVHGFCIWWVLSRSGRLVEGKSGHMLPADAFNGLIRVPFGNFFLGFRTVFCSLKANKESGKTKSKQLIWIVFAALLCAALFIRAAGLLSAADSDFGAYLEGFLSGLRFELDVNFILCIIISIPVWCWLYGLLGGLYRLDSSVTEEELSDANTFLIRIRRIPAALWCVVVGAFSVMYVAFFIMQGSYLFGAFTRTLPEGFIVSEYARQGFFELCRIMALNFAVLWLVTRMNDGNEKGRGFIRILCAVLLIESIIFAVIAFSKLYLYISCFGFTPKRLQSSWLVCVLFAGCVLWLYTLFTERPVFRKWMIFAAVSLSVLALI